MSKPAFSLREKVAGGRMRVQTPNHAPNPPYRKRLSGYNDTGEIIAL